MFNDMLMVLQYKDSLGTNTAEKNSNHFLCNPKVLVAVAGMGGGGAVKHCCSSKILQLLTGFPATTGWQVGL